MPNADRQARIAWSSNATGAPNTAIIPSPVNLSTVPPYRCTTEVAQLTNSVMISRNRSAPTAPAMSIEWTTSANSTVTCLYSAGFAAGVTAAPHSLQNLEFGASSVPHDAHTNPAVVMASPRPTSCAPRSQEMSPSRGSGPDSPDTTRRCLRPDRAEPAIAATRFLSVRTQGRSAKRPTARWLPLPPADHLRNRGTAATLQTPLKPAHTKSPCVRP